MPNGAAARRFRRTHHHLDVPQTYEDPSGYPMGRWLIWKRHLRAKGTLGAVRVHALERLGIIWDPRQQAFDRALAYAARHGHLAASVDEITTASPSAAGGHVAHPRRDPHARTRRRARRPGPVVEPALADHLATRLPCSPTADRKRHRCLAGGVARRPARTCRHRCPEVPPGSTARMKDSPGTTSTSTLTASRSPAPRAGSASPGTAPTPHPRPPPPR
ncbi:helicase associated domain-containing protein [Streptomyces sp. R08]|uniref:Helicase associated domain-containing protein n=1 Tax=Streptomyces sp. R08 TaxID=3238624 RepID=A0AB39MQ75_9ACTN